MPTAAMELWAEMLAPPSSHGLRGMEPTLGSFEARTVKPLLEESGRVLQHLDITPNMAGPAAHAA